MAPSRTENRGRRYPFGRAAREGQSATPLAAWLDAMRFDIRIPTLTGFNRFAKNGRATGYTEHENTKRLCCTIRSRRNTTGMKHSGRSARFLTSRQALPGGVRNVICQNN